MLVVFKIIIGLFKNQLLNTGAFVFHKKEILLTPTLHNTTHIYRPYNFNVGCPNSIFRLKPRTSLIGNAVLQYIHSTKSFDFIIGTFLVNSVTYT